MTKASNKDKDLIVDILVSAFSLYKEENSINLIVKQDKKRIQRMRILMGYLFERSILFGEIFISDNKNACLLIKYPHKEKITLKTILLDIQLAYKCIGIERLFKVLKRQQLTKQNYPNEEHIQPMILGVKKEFKGKGVAARLMLKVKDKFKDNKLPVIIDAASEHNVLLYKKFGFRVTKKEENLGFPIYFLRLN